MVRLASTRAGLSPCSAAWARMTSAMVPNSWDSSSSAVMTANSNLRSSGQPGLAGRRLALLRQVGGGGKFAQGLHVAGAGGGVAHQEKRRGPVEHDLGGGVDQAQPAHDLLPHAAGLGSRRG